MTENIKFYQSDIIPTFRRPANVAVDSRSAKGVRVGGRRVVSRSPSIPDPTPLKYTAHRIPQTEDGHR